MFLFKHSSQRLMTCGNSNLEKQIKCTCFYFRDAFPTRRHFCIKIIEFNAVYNKVRIHTMKQTLYAKESNAAINKNNYSFKYTLSTIINI